MAWNWTLPDWPDFRYDASALEPFEQTFLLSSGEILGAVHHVSQPEREQLRIELLSEEAMQTSAIEGEILDRLSVQSSLRRHLGLDPDSYPAKPREQGVAEMMVDVYSSFAEPLTHETLYRWHRMLLSRDSRLETIGAYRQHAEAMQIVSGRLDRPTIHFEAPPSERVMPEMERYADWFNKTGPGGAEPLPALTRAGLSHLYFESIHPFEDGNGRLGRALAEKSLAQNIGQPTLISLAFTNHHSSVNLKSFKCPSHRRNSSFISIVVANGCKLVKVRALLGGAPVGLDPTIFADMHSSRRESS